MRLYRKNRVGQRSKLLIVLPFLFIVVFLIFFSRSSVNPVRDNFKNKGFTHGYRYISPLSDSNPKSVSRWNIFGSLVSLFKPSLEEVVRKELAGTAGTYGIVVKNLENGREARINDNELFYMASLYKVMVMYESYKRVDEGSLNLDDPVGNSTWREAIESMVTVSDNLAGSSLGTRLGWGNIESSMHSLGLNDTTLSTDLTSTPSDIAALFLKIATGKAVSEKYSREMIETLLRQRLNSRIPRLLPPEAKVAHKTGELDQNRHDAGIVFLPSGTSYIIVVMSRDSGLDQVSSEVIARISKRVYEYFND